MKILDTQKIAYPFAIANDTEITLRIKKYDFGNVTLQIFIRNIEIYRNSFINMDGVELPMQLNFMFGKTIEEIRRAIHFPTDEAMFSLFFHYAARCGDITFAECDKGEFEILKRGGTYLFNEMVNF